LFDLAGRFYTAPGMSYLTSAPTTYSAGMQTLGLGLGAIGSGVPQMISPDVGANLGMVNQQNITAAQAAQAQARATQQAGLYSAIGSVVGGIGGSFFGPIGTAVGSAIGSKIGGAAGR